MQNSTDVKQKKPLILITEDDSEMARLNSRLLARNGYDTVTAGTAAEALDIARRRQPDLFVLDIGLPDGDGISLCKKLRGLSMSPVLFLTGRSSVSDKVTGLRSGGDYYLTKPYDSRELLAVIENLLKRNSDIQNLVSGTAIIVKGSLTLDPAQSKAYVNGQDVCLSPKEFAILLLLARHENEELTYETIYRSVWGCDMGNDSGALRKQVSRLKMKLGEDSAKDFAIYNDYGKGYTFMRMG